jgi:CopG family nickel-responsive transcriptional regulator
MNILTDIQHDFYQLIISSQHVHLDHDNCLEIIVVRGRPREVKKLADKLRATKGVKYGALSIATTGEELV